MPPERRRPFSAAFKKKVILRAEASNNCVAAREFDVAEKCVRYWRNQRERLFACANNRQAFRGPASGKYAALEAEVSAFVIGLRDRSLAVTVEALQEKARAIATRDAIPRSEFSASRGWATRFMRRSGLCLRRRTSICQRLPDAYEEKLFAFRRYVLSLRREQGYAIGQIGNADQTPVYFDMTRSTTVTKRGSRQVNILSTGNERSRFTVMLAATADGWKLPPFLVFKRKTLPKERFPHNVIVRTNEKGFFNDDLVLEWLRLVWDRRPGALLGLPNMLVLDSFRGHLTAKVKEKLRSSGTDLVVIPGGMTSQLQPLDVMLNKPFKDRVRKLYTEWMGKTDNPLTPTGRVKRASLAEVASWVAAAWYNLPDALVARSFKKCGLSNAMDGTEDDAVYEDSDKEDSDSCASSSDE